MLSLIGSGFFLVILIAGVMIFLHFVPLGLWISALAADVRYHYLGRNAYAQGSA